MARIERRKALRLLWQKANENGMSSEYLHDILSMWVQNGLVKTNRLSAMENSELSWTLEQLFRVKMFIYDEPMTKYIRSLIRSTHGLGEKVEGVLRKWKKESIYQTTPKQKQFLVGYCVGEHQKDAGVKHNA